MCVCVCVSHIFRDVAVESVSCLDDEVDSERLEGGAGLPGIQQSQERQTHTRDCSPPGIGLQVYIME